MYNMNHDRRGKAIIFNHTKFEDSSLSEREGTKVDKTRLSRTLEEALKFEVEIYEDLRISEMKKILKNLSLEDHRDADCLFVALFTHGTDNGRLYDAEGTDYSQDELWKPFLNDESSLSGKPKIFVIQACRGEKVGLGFGGVSNHNPPQVDQGAIKRGIMRNDAIGTSSRAGFEFDSRIPNNADFLIYRSTPEGYVSWRHPDMGSWFIQAICDVIGLWEEKITDH